VSLQEKKLKSAVEVQGSVFRAKNLIVRGISEGSRDPGCEETKRPENVSCNAVRVCFTKKERECRRGWGTPCPTHDTG